MSNNNCYVKRNLLYPLGAIGGNYVQVFTRSKIRPLQFRHKIGKISLSSDDCVIITLKKTTLMMTKFCTSVVLPVFQLGSLFHHWLGKGNRVSTETCSERAPAANALRHLEQKRKQHNLRLQQRHLFPADARLDNSWCSSHQRWRTRGHLQWRPWLGLWRLVIQLFLFKSRDETNWLFFVKR